MAEYPRGSGAATRERSLTHHRDRPRPLVRPVEGARSRALAANVAVTMGPSHEKTRASRRAGRHDSAPVLQFKVQLQEIEPAIWRREGLPSSRVHTRQDVTPRGAPNRHPGRRVPGRAPDPSGLESPPRSALHGRGRAPLISTTSVTAGSTCSSSRGRAPGRAVCATRAALPVHARVRPRTWVGRRTMRSSSRRTLVFLQQIQPGWRVRRSILRRVLQLTVIVPSFREARWHRRSLRERCSPSPSAT